MLVEYVKDNYYMQGFMILAIIGTEKDTLVFYSMQMLTDGRKVELLYPTLL